MEPDPPKIAPKYLREGLPKQSPETLRAIAGYANALADYKIKQAQAEVTAEAVDKIDTAEQWDEDEWNRELGAAYDKANIELGTGSITVNQIDGRGYYYLKWSENGQFQSQYIAPVSPKKRNESN
jgi:hypothetical protein